MEADQKVLIAQYHDALAGSLSGLSERDRYWGRVTLEIQPGHGEILGQLLRHALLTAVPGFAVTGVKVSYDERSAGGRSAQVSHAYARIPGVVQDVRQIMANLGRVTVRLHSDRPLVHTVYLRGPRDVTGRAVLEHPHIELLTPDIDVARITGEVDLALEVTIAKGVGFQQARAWPGQDVYLLPMDARFQPVRRVSIQISSIEEQHQQSQQVEWNIETKGNVSPREAWEHAVRHVLREDDQ